ncbi:MAG TPA: prolyl oligopeptidase family serine peptidase [Thermoanaerobaculia bacterium]|nr:prolyl oligopeptidase family serine peptidase [Thermoanaerobaculia bacterium]
MRATPFRVLASLVLFLPLAIAAPPAAGQAGEGIAPEDRPIPVPETITARHVPPIPQADVADLLPYENLRGASFQDWHPSERRVLITTRFGEVTQLHEVAQPLGARRQLTFYGERVLGGEYRPAASGQIGFRMDEGGAENYQLFLMDTGSGEVTRISDGEHRYEGATFSPDGSRIAYVSNRRNGRDFDLYVADPGDPASERRVAELSGAWYPTDWSPDGRRLLMLRYVSANQSFLHLVDLASGTLTALTPPPADGGEPVSYSPGKFSADGTAVYTTTDRGSEMHRLARLDLDSRRWTTLTGDVEWNVESFDLSKDGATLAFLVNEDGFSRLHLRDARTNQPLPAPDLPLGVAGSLRFRPDSQEVGFTLSWARSSSDVYSWDPRTARLTRWTESEMGGLPPEHFVRPELVRFPTFDEVEPGVRRTIPAFVFRPDPQRHAPPWPVYIDIHGGPEGQERPRFQGTMNHLPANLGVALVYPNVRGSAGYGKSYLLLDNAERREDSVRDIGALLDWIAAQPDLDAGRVMVGGGSYGGYMTLAAMVAYNDRLCCGFDYVGISDFVTFLENTEGYRRDLRRAEYGDERDPEMRRFLASIAPLAKADRITKPMLVAQGANDPRVPLSEADQIVAALEANGTPVWYVVAADEGHGFAKKSNSDYLRAVTMEFIETHLLAPPAATQDGGAADRE